MQNENETQNQNDNLGMTSPLPSNGGSGLSESTGTPVNQTATEMPNSPNPESSNPGVELAPKSTMENHPIETFTDPSIPTKKKSPIGIIIVLVLLVVAGIGGYYYFSSAMMTPKNVFTMAIENIYEVAKSVYEPDKDANLASILASEKGLSANLNGKLNLKTGGEKSSYGFTTKLETDKDYENILLNFGLTDSGGTVLDISAYQKDDKTYLESKKLFDHIIDLGETIKDATGDTDIEELTEDDIYGLLTLTKDYLIENMEEKDFTESKGTLSVNGKTYEVDKYTYVLTKEVAEKLFTGYADAVENSSLTLGDETYESIQEFKNVDYSNMETVYINIYANKKEIYGFDFEQDDVKLVRFNYVDGLLDAGIEDGEESVKFKGKTTDGKLTIDAYSTMDGKEEKFGTFTIEELSVKNGKEKIKINYSIDTEGTSVSGIITLNAQTEIKGKDVHSTYEIELTIATAEFEVGLEFELDAKTIDTVTLPNISNTVKIEDLTGDDYLNMLDNFENALKGTDYEFIVDLLDMLYGTSYDDYDYDYDYDYDFDYDDYDYGF